MVVVFLGFFGGLRWWPSGLFTPPTFSSGDGVRDTAAVRELTLRGVCSGVTKYPYPARVWSPSGGWWNTPARWPINTALVAAGIFGLIALGTLLPIETKRYPANEKWARFPKQEH